MVVLISGDFSKLILIAFLIAPLAWWAMSGWLQKYEYRIAVEWWMIAVPGLITVTLALATVSFQAIKAASGNPVRALRSE